MYIVLALPQNGLGDPSGHLSGFLFLHLSNWGSKTCSANITRFVRRSQEIRKVNNICEKLKILAVAANIYTQYGKRKR